MDKKMIAKKGVHCDFEGIYLDNLNKKKMIMFATQREGKDSDLVVEIKR